jgi:hypothetical protein
MGSFLIIFFQEKVNKINHPNEFLLNTYKNMKSCNIMSIRNMKNTKKMMNTCNNITSTSMERNMNNTMNTRNTIYI